MSKMTKNDSVDWGALRIGSVELLSGLWVVKVADTAVETAPKSLITQKRILFDCHRTGNGRLVGYSISCRTNLAPRVAVGLHYLGLFFSRDFDGDRALTVLYHDQDVRLLGFGAEPRRDYMLVIRNQTGG